jgi:hypothetical protein
LAWAKNLKLFFELVSIKKNLNGDDLEYFFFTNTDNQGSKK